jgi:dephospho-CoA kinase
LKVYGVTGLPGSGKSIISRLAKNEGVHIVSMGDVVRKEAEKQNCTSAAAAVNLRKKYGNNVIAERCVDEIIKISRNRINNHTTTTKIYKGNNKNNNPKSSHRKFKKVEQDVYIIEGIRSPFEVNIFKKNFRNFKIIAIHSNPEVRYNRLKRRKRADDSSDYKTFLERDRRELKFGIGNVVALADFMLINEGPIPIFKNNVRALIANEIKPTAKYSSKNYNKNKQNRKHGKGQKQFKKYNNKRPRNNNHKNRQQQKNRNKRRY